MHLQFQRVTVGSHIILVGRIAEVTVTRFFRRFEAFVTKANTEAKCNPAEHSYNEDATKAAASYYGNLHFNGQRWGTICKE